MLDLREEYINKDTLKEETICDFKVSQEMKTVWAAEQKVLSTIIKICEKYNLTYYADYGTLLGAVRHNGFIPWDDDIDICLKRADYMKLLKVLPKELPQHYYINSCHINTNNTQPWSIVSNYNTLPIPAEIKIQFFNCPYIVGVDIFVLDYLPQDEELSLLMINIYNAIYDLVQRFDEFKKNGELEKYTKIIEDMCKVQLIHDNTLKNQLYILEDTISSMFTNEESQFLTQLPRIVSIDKNFKYHKHCLDDVIKMDFNGLKINVPIGYEEVLTAYYGNYKSPIYGVSQHDYPFFNKQKHYLKKINML